jgi:UPF0755 protein
MSGEPEVRSVPSAPVEPPRRSDRHGPPGERSRRGALLILLVAFLVLIGGVVAAGAYYGRCRGASGPRDPVSFTVRRGMAGEQVVERLHDLGVIRCGGFVGRILLRGTGKADQILAGDYGLTTNMTFDDAIDVLTTPPPPVPTVRVTIPEGYRLTQIAERVHDALGISQERFLASAERPGWSLPPYLPSGHGTEGFLFPKTYDFVKEDTGPDDVVRRMLDQFDTEAKTLPWKNAEGLGVSPYEVVIIASMIEREARVPSDRPKIAAVIYHRLALGMTLGIDATLLYDDPTPDGQLSASDLESNSPYNTRVHAGLPPTPIASPGRPSIRAALSPADVPFLYYVLCGADGHHRFSVDYDVFLHDKAVCLG